MAYVYIFAACYVFSAAFIVADHRRKNRLAAARLREMNMSAEHVANFHRNANSGFVMLLIRPTLFFGSIAGVIISAIYWFAS